MVMFSEKGAIDATRDSPVKVHDLFLIRFPILSVTTLRYIVSVPIGPSKVRSIPSIPIIRFTPLFKVSCTSRRIEVFPSPIIRRLVTSLEIGLEENLRNRVEGGYAAIFERYSKVRRRLITSARVIGIVGPSLDLFLYLYDMVHSCDYSWEVRCYVS